MSQAFVQQTEAACNAFNEEQPHNSGQNHNGSATTNYYYARGDPSTPTMTSFYNVDYYSHQKTVLQDEYAPLPLMPSFRAGYSPHSPPVNLSEATTRTQQSVAEEASMSGTIMLEENLSASSKHAVVSDEQMTLKYQPGSPTSVEHIVAAFDQDDLELLMDLLPVNH